MVSSVLCRMKKYFHIFKLMEPSNSRWEVRETEKIFPFSCRDLSLQLVKSQSFHIRLEPKSSGFPPRTLSSRMVCWKVALLYDCLYYEDADTNSSWKLSRRSNLAPVLSSMTSFFFKVQSIPRCQFPLAVHYPNILIAQSCPPPMGP